MQVNFNINTDNKSTVFPHYWEVCVGSCHAYTALREDYRKQLKIAHDELGFKYVRFHGLFNDDMSVVRNKPTEISAFIPTNELQYNFVNIDNIFDFLLSIGMKPFLELGFMPSLLASGEECCFHYKGNITPPKDYDLWSHFIESFVKHLEERYGEEEVALWFFEVWNEPNIAHFWKGDINEYFKLYDYTVRAVKKVNEKYVVGGPASAGNEWIPEFREYCNKNNVPCDFISTHHYPTVDLLWDNPFETFKLIEEKGTDILSTKDRHCMRDMAKKAKKEARELPLYYTEWNASAMIGEKILDTTYAAAFVARILNENQGLVNGYSFWTFSDIFEEVGQLSNEFHGGFGMMTIHGIKKPVYRVFEMFHNLGDVKLDVTSNGYTEGNVQLIATEGEDSLKLLLLNHDVPVGNIKKESVKIAIESGKAYNKAIAYRIDNEHANPKREWTSIGSPEYLNASQIEMLNNASELIEEELQIKVNENGMEIELEIAENSVIAINIV
jgi:xylan 1,4-beta-xylosidase